MSKNTLTEDELHAYVDERLSGVARAEVEDYLAAHPDEAARVRVFQAQNESLRALFEPILDEPIPARLRVLAEPSVTPRSELPHSSRLGRWSLQRIAASVFLCLVGGLLGWVARGSPPTSDGLARVTPLPHQAAIAHAVFSPDVRRPVEVSAEHEDQLVAWLSKRLGTPVRPPKLQTLGYELIGGRLLPGDIGPVAQFMYQDATGQRLTLYVSTENTANQETAFRFAQEGAVNVFYWIDGKFGYALSASIDKGELARVATAVYDQLDRK